MLRTLISIALLLPLTAFARDWQVDAAQSTLTFKGTYQGESFDGRFKKFDATIAYDAADPAKSKFDVNVDLASADTASTAERQDLPAGELGLVHEIAGQDPDVFVRLDAVAPGVMVEDVRAS